MSLPTNSSRSFLVMYLAQLAANPLRTKAITSSVLAGCQEAAAQKLSGQKHIDKRVLHMAAYGLILSGPLSHFLYEIMNRLFAGKTGNKVKVGQLLFSNLIISPIMNTVYVSAMSVLAGSTSINQIKQAVKSNLLGMQKVSWVISPVSMIVAQNFLPQATWVPFFNLIIFFFGTYINTMIKRKRIAQEKAKRP
ncbi:hypothetical protein J3Q64DRAFT_1744261 [Phycomyces blakesleeanus]|uniref:Uncharacterized protein n=2 Tax=Phycomyces blakesleeanus TaxID=4837 RepID=A0A162X9R1_PHYB8|nr:hypothetical protein PHYBLDRAFT_66026 [Phycomyces blakesleeanus NRRL 1555(-)]OAD73415.1 hypothetical protein PHYBLDRAFT_66026 [Phycomyces blakesleeanus NRRL 1555(-)]|eukprot:XP_018291455.1 hypothetical protein PHYBLDRAFT_66026 [Phycomyces blakesleeanus NRRL 1555(-)]